MFDLYRFKKVENVIKCYLLILQNMAGKMSMKKYNIYSAQGSGEYIFGFNHG